ncbi:hypothetical protein F4775DRAFT_41870 [Biscogniauxia sp. FL1348]|nr:hypothetical protein F4775DRAFT_41870 [Biscogniauxia sp. FL1348]
MCETLALWAGALLLFLFCSASVEGSLGYAHVGVGVGVGVEVGMQRPCSGWLPAALVPDLNWKRLESLVSLVTGHKEASVSQILIAGFSQPSRINPVPLEFHHDLIYQPLYLLTTLWSYHRRVDRSVCVRARERIASCLQGGSLSLADCRLLSTLGCRDLAAYPKCSLSTYQTPNRIHNLINNF